MTPTDKPTQVGGLLPCPCGAGASINILFDDPEVWEGHCDDPSCSWGMTHLGTKAEATSRWNRRANVQALEARLVKLEKEIRDEAGQHEVSALEVDSVGATEAACWQERTSVMKYAVADKLAALLESKP